MSAWRAIARAEARQVRSEVTALAVAMLVVPAVALAFTAPDARPEAGLIVPGLLAFAAALVLGAGLFAGQPAPAFLAGRPIGPMTAMIARLGVRCGALLVVMACALPAVALSGAAHERGLALAGVAVFVALGFVGAALASVTEPRSVGAAAGGILPAVVSFLLTVVLWFGLVTDPSAAPLQLVLAGFVVFALELLVLAGLACLRADAAWDARRFANRLAAGLALVPLALLAAWILAGTQVSGRRLDAAIARWEAERGPVRPVTPVVASAQAQEADERARRLGFALATRPGEDWKQRPRLSRDIAGDIARAAGTPSGDVPASVAAWLDENAAAVAELREILADGGLTWRVDDSRGEPLPGLIAHAQLAKLLALDAAHAPESAGEDAAAIRALSESLLAHPSVPSRLVGVSLSRQEARAARARHDPAPLAPPDFAEMERRLLAAGIADADAVAREERRSIVPTHLRGDAPPLVRLIGTTWSPLARWEAARELDVAREEARTSAELAPCELLESAPAKASSSRRFDLVASPMHVAAARYRVAIVAMEWELTSIVHDVRALRSADADAAVPPDFLRSRLCPERSWILKDDADGWAIEPWPEFHRSRREVLPLHREPKPVSP